MCFHFFYIDYIFQKTVHEATRLGDDGKDSSSSSTFRDNARASLQTRKNLLALQYAVAAPERAPFPVIAAVHGHVIGLGVDLISACDIRYAASNSVFSIQVSCVSVSGKGGGRVLITIYLMHPKLVHLFIRKSISVCPQTLDLFPIFQNPREINLLSVNSLIPHVHSLLAKRKN